MKFKVVVLVASVWSIPSSLCAQKKWQKSFFASCASNAEIDALFFTPDQASEYKKILIELITTEKKSIKAALFRLTDQNITDELVEAHRRGVQLQIVVDPGALQPGFYSKVGRLYKEGVPLYTYTSVPMLPLKKLNYTTLMHHKFFIFEDTCTGKVVVYGSLNPTHAAFHGNEEAVSIRNKKSIIKSFEKQFEKVKKRSELLSYMLEHKKGRYSTVPFFLHAFFKRFVKSL